MEAQYDTGGIKKEENILAESSKLRLEAQDLLAYIERFLVNPPEKDQKECRGVLSKPLDELKCNLHDTMFCLTKIRELFNAEIVNRLS